MTEIYKIINHIAPPIMSSLSEIRENTQNTRYFEVLCHESRRTVNCGLETVGYRAPFLWANLPPEYKLANSSNIFRRKIRNWKGENCPCRLCKTYVRELGYILFSRESANLCNLFFLQLKKKKNFQRLTVHRKKFKNSL